MINLQDITREDVERYARNNHTPIARAWQSLLYNEQLVAEPYTVSEFVIEAQTMLAYTNIADVLPVLIQAQRWEQELAHLACFLEREGFEMQGKNAVDAAIQAMEQMANNIDGG